MHDTFLFAFEKLFILGEVGEGCVASENCWTSKLDWPAHRVLAVKETGYKQIILFLTDVEALLRHSSLKRMIPKEATKSISTLRFDAKTSDTISLVHAYHETCLKNCCFIGIY